MDEAASLIYKGITALVWLVTFIGCWIYCVAEYGFLLGVGLGWLPAGIVATLAALLWPLIVLAGALIWLKYGNT